MAPRTYSLRLRTLPPPLPGGWSGSPTEGRRPIRRTLRGLRWTGLPLGSGARRLGEVRPEHALDLRGARPALDAVGGLLVLDEDERRDARHAELLGELRALLGIPARHPEAIALLACEVGEEAHHPPRRARSREGEEE